jgi:hypothetical protein
MKKYKMEMMRTCLVIVGVLAILMNANIAAALTSFIAEPYNGGVILIWETATEIDNVGFDLYRSESENGEYILLNDDIIIAEGSETEGMLYEFDDEEVENKTYYYLLEVIDIYGVSTLYGTVSVTPKMIYE